MSLFDANVVFEASTLTGNAANGRGGGIDLNSGTVTLTNCGVQRNEASTGGGIYSALGSVMSTQSFFGTPDNAPESIVQEIFTQSPHSYSYGYVNSVQCNPTSGCIAN